MASSRSYNECLPLVANRWELPYHGGTTMRVAWYGIGEVEVLVGVSGE